VKSKSFSVIRNGKREELTIEVVKNPNISLDVKDRKKLLVEVESLVQDSWGEFKDEYLEKSVLNVYLLCLIRNSKNEIIALAPVKKLLIKDKTIYSFGLTVVHPKYRRLNLLNKMGLRLASSVIFENILRGRFSIEVIFITPNILTIGTIAKKAKFMYPNPYLIKKDGTLDEADDETWDLIKKYLDVSGERYRSLDRRGSIMEGFYDDKKELVVKKREHNDEKLNIFGEKYLYAKSGREVVIYAKVSLFKVIFT